MKLYLYSILFSLNIALIAQNNIINNEPCATTQQFKESIKNNPALKESVDKQIQNYLNTKTQFIAQRTTTIIPVVFHVIHQGGAENLPDSQIINQINILNECFANNDPQKNNRPAYFNGLAGNVAIEFRLARKDPQGRCTNGINRIYSTLTNTNTGLTKGLIHWNSRKYLNIYIVQNISGSSNTLAYSSLPEQLVGEAVNDGIAIEANVVGNTDNRNYAQANYRKGKTLVHEVGHWLGLGHIWQDYAGNADECGNDNINDTPVQFGPPFGCPSYPFNQAATLATCGVNNAPHGEMFMNYMNYVEDSCMNLFSLDQTTRINWVLNNIRTEIWSASNLIATGTDMPQPACLNGNVTAYFQKNKSLVCEGTSVTFTDFSYGSKISSRQWFFTGATPSTSTDSLVTVTYNTLGSFSVKLVVTDTSSNTDTLFLDSLIHVKAPISINNTGFFEDFQNATTYPLNWSVGSTFPPLNWELNTNVGYNSSSSIFLNNHANVFDAEEEIVSSRMDISQVINPKLQFYVSFARFDAGSLGILRVFGTNTCGNTWTQLWAKSASGLATTADNGGVFAPTQASEWRLETVNIPASLIASPNFQLKFYYKANGGNNLYLDNINILPGALVNIQENNTSSVNLYPNPITEGNFTISHNLNNPTIVVYNTLGELVPVKYTTTENTINVTVNGITKGIYIVKLESKNTVITKKISIN